MKRGTSNLAKKSTIGINDTDVQHHQILCVSIPIYFNWYLRKVSVCARMRGVLGELWSSQHIQSAKTTSASTMLCRVVCECMWVLFQQPTCNDHNLEHVSISVSVSVWLFVYLIYWLTSCMAVRLSQADRYARTNQTWIKPTTLANEYWLRACWRV